jgi:hypothetical protein
MLRNALLNKHRKGELTFTQIVYAILALIVITVMILYFTGNLQRPNNTMNSCSINRATCEENRDKCIESNGVVLPGNYSDCKSPEVCCFKT